MLRKLFHKLQGDRKYFAIVFFIILLIFTIGVITPRVIEFTQENWGSEISKRIVNIQSDVNKLFKKKENKLWQN